ncbi:MAG TPA: heme o synthase [Kofleriaceae bacterium]|jgi:protoheme IX farnesyltransferase|nr:heme o synthase [Kofleriaceae bacterium]
MTLRLGPFGPSLRASGSFSARRVSISDLIALFKPRIAAMTLLSAAGGMGLAPGAVDPTRALVMLVGTALIVGAANTLNMYLEREVDCLMARTKNRPLPAGRLDPQVALVFGVAQALVSVPLLTFGLGSAGPITGLLAVIAFVSYVMVYTPMKQRSHIATWVGAIPGAMPALMGWTAATGRIDAAGLAVFGVLFFWQIPHFHAIALYRFKEYQRAGLATLPAARGAAMTRVEIVLYAVVQLVVSLLLYPLGVCGPAYLVIAAICGFGFAGYAAAGLVRGDARWARNVFLWSIVYLPLVYTAMVLDGRL